MRVTLSLSFQSPFSSLYLSRPIKMSLNPHFDISNNYISASYIYLVRFLQVM
jgi:hypothetical protein